ncbi:HAMP domain-containing protein [Nonomuraea recticatena]|uniref:HAMP domain-containing protein n=1 Tax=Nonomuraea recticatena TaxID=46178 RepID=UPI003606204E
MTRPWRSLRAGLAVLGFLAIYLPALLLFGVVLVTDTETTFQTIDGVESVRSVSAHRSAWPTWTIVALAPAAAAVAWWWAGRAVRPLDRVRAVAEDIGATDLGRRIALDGGPAEVVALAASFDAMLDRLEQAAATQRRLIEETSHELRMPLAVLMTNAEVLLAHPSPTLEVYRGGCCARRPRPPGSRRRSTSCWPRLVAGPAPSTAGRPTWWRSWAASSTTPRHWRRGRRSRCPSAGPRSPSAPSTSPP